MRINIANNNHRKIIIIASIFIILLLIPLLFWGNYYIVGGDDTRLYYLFPKEFIFNFAFKITSDNSLGALVGYYPKSYLVPILTIILLLKLLPVNVQLLMYGLNFAFGFLFFYLLLGIFYDDKKNTTFYEKITASLFYIFSTYLLKTFYDNQLLSIYLITAIPGTIYLFLKGFIQQKIRLIILSSLFFSLLSSTFVTLPWSLALLVVFLPFMIFYFVQSKKRFVVYLLIFLSIALLLNFYWLSFHIYSFFQKGSAFSPLRYYDSSQFHQDNSRFISIASNVYKSINTIFNERMQNFILKHNYLSILKSIFILIIVFSGIFLKKMKIEIKKYFIVSIFSLLLSFYFFQPDFGKWSIGLFVFLNDHLPFFSIFRNMYDKFSYSIAFTYASALYAALIIISNKFKNKNISKVLMFLLLIISLINIWSFLFPNPNVFRNDPIRISGKLNNDYLNLINYSKKLDYSSRLLWLPLNYPSYVYIEDEFNSGHFYFGPSILTVLSKRSDFAGYLAFGTGFEPEAGGRIFGYIANSEYDKFGKEMQQLNVNYIVVNNSQLPNNLKNFLYSANMLAMQNTEFKNAILGKKLASFGRYDIYEIKDFYKSKKIYLENSDGNKTKMDFIKVTDSEFIVKIHNLKASNKLVLQDLYNPSWTVNLIGKNDIELFGKSKSKSGNNYLSNVWVLDQQKIMRHYNANYYKLNSNGGIDIDLRISLFQNKISLISILISLATVFFIFIYWFIFFITKNFQPKKISKRKNNI